MQNEVELIIGRDRYREWSSVTVTSDVYSADSAMRLTTNVKGLEIPDYEQFALKVNGVQVMSGVITGVEEEESKESRRIAITGRDMMGLLIDEYVETFRTYEGYTIRRLAETLLSPLPLVKKSIAFDPVGLERMIVPKAFAQTTPGQRVFEVLSNVAFSRGLMLYCTPDGTITFASPRTGTSKYTLVWNQDKSNVKAHSRVRDLTKWYRKVMVVGQKQGIDGFAPEEINVEGIATDLTHPLKHKTFVCQLNDDAGSGAHHAKLIMAKQRFEAFSFNYTVSGFQQGDALWDINEIATVRDEKFRLNEPMMIYSREFSQSKEGGSITNLKIGGLPS